MRILKTLTFLGGIAVSAGPSQAYGLASLPSTERLPRINLACSSFNDERIRRVVGQWLVQDGWAILPEFNLQPVENLPRVLRLLGRAEWAHKVETQVNKTQHVCMVAH